ncbi:MAG: CPBP family intramembrane glutamic endopeptidase [Lachnospirales bacterium]
MNTKSILNFILIVVRTIIATFLAIVGFFLGAVIRDQIYNFFPNGNQILLGFAGLIVQILAILLLLFIAAKIDGKSLKDYGIKWKENDGSNILKGILLGAILFSIACLPMYILGYYELTTRTFSWTEIIVDLFGCIAVGVVEEYMFRGFILHKLAFFGKIPAIIISGCIFAFAHLGNLGVSPVVIANIVLMGAFWAILMFITDSIHLLVGFHFIWDFVEGSILSIPFGDDKPYGILLTKLVNTNPFYTGGEFGLEGSIVLTPFLVVITIIAFVYAYKNGKLSKNPNSSLTLNN